MELKTIRDDSEFHRLRDAWNRLTPEPLLSWEWNYWWWKYLGQRFQLRILTATQQGELVGIAPFLLQSRGGEQCLRFLGSGPACTDYVRIISRPEFAQQFCHWIATEIKKRVGELSDVSLIELEGVSNNTHVTPLVDQLRQAFWRYDHDLESSWVVGLDNRWDDFVKTRHRAIRRKIRKAEQRYARGQAIVKSTRRGLEVDAAFGVLRELHQQRQTAKGQPGVFADERFSGFLKMATKSLAARGKAEIVVCESDGQPIAAQLYLISPAGPQLYQSGVCSQSTHFEPGHLLYTHTIKQAILDGYTTFDFLRGDEPYKALWGGVRTPLTTVRCVSRRLPNTVKHQLIRGLRLAKLAFAGSRLSTPAGLRVVR